MKQVLQVAFSLSLGAALGAAIYGDSLTIQWTHTLPDNRQVRFKFVQRYVIWVNDDRQKT